MSPRVLSVCAAAAMNLGARASPRDAWLGAQVEGSRGQGGPARMSWRGVVAKETTRIRHRHERQYGANTRCGEKREEEYEDNATAETDGWAPEQDEVAPACARQGARLGRLGPLRGKRKSRSNAGL